MENKQNIESLIQNTQSPDLAVRLEAIRSLGKSGESDALEPLIACLNLINRDWPTHEAAAEALGDLGDPRAIPALLSVLRSSERQGGSAVEHALGEIGTPALQPLLEILKSTEDHVMRRAASHALSAIGPSAVEALLDLMQMGGQVAWGSIAALGRIGDPRAVKPLLARLKTSVDDRWAIIDALGDICDPRATEPLCEILRDEDEFTRMLIIRALNSIGDERALPDLKRVAAEYQDHKVDKDLKYWLDLTIELFEKKEKSKHNIS